ncbi:hypothetical protein [Methanococcoides burtonii]|uniref:hypothetical protein n=1 Tax=Methanococcoides burtonii TaxID=29291 RepID=UPI00064F7890|nr:hypothetical protein [Methanococcoides burtonii]
MDKFKILIDFLKDNIGIEFESPRRVFQRKRVPQNFNVIDVDSSMNRIKVQFQSGTILPIEYWRLKEAISFIDSPNFIPIGSSISENYHLNSIEGKLKEIAKAKSGKSTDTKTAPHIIDLLVLSGIVELGKAISDNGRKVDGARLNQGNY